MKINKTDEIDNHADWIAILFLIITPFAAIALTTWYVLTTPFQLSIWLLGLLFYTLTAGSITSGYHRLFSHRSYEASRPLKLFYALFGAAAFQHSILKWSLDHRIHHRFVDTDLDPYSIKKGFWHAHFLWMCKDQHYPDNKNSYIRDLQKDPIVIWQHRHYILIASIMCFFVPMFLGWLLGSALGGLAVAGFLRLTLVHHFTFFINSWCHWMGKSSYTDEHSAKDSFLMALFTFGEGYHNFHHTFASDYRNGIRWFDWDPTKWIIRLTAALGLAKNLKRSPEGVILAARMRMDEKRLRERFSNSWESAFEERMQQLRDSVSMAQARWTQLKQEYRDLRRSYDQASHARLEKLRMELRLARAELRYSLNQWQTYYSSMMSLQTVPA